LQIHKTRKLDIVSARVHVTEGGRERDRTWGGFI